MEWGPAQVRELFHLAADIKARPDRYRGALEGKFLAMIFEKPSLRTRVTFEVGIASLGGASVFLDHPATRLRGADPFRRRCTNLSTDGSRNRRARILAGVSGSVASRRSPFSLYRTNLASFTMTGYNPKDAEGFINLFALPITVPQETEIRRKAEAG